MACESEQDDEEIAPVRAPLPAQSASMISTKERGPSLTVALCDLPNFGGRMGLDLMVILKERQQQKRVLERELKAAESALARKGFLPILRETLVVVLDDEDDVKSGKPAVGGGRSAQATADFETGFKATGPTPKETVSNPEGQGTEDVPKTRDFGLVEEGGQSV